MKTDLIPKIKHFLMFIAIFFIATMNIFAQGNSGNNGQGKLWEKNQTTGNIYNTGLTNYVGIGTDIPLYPLEVKGFGLIDSMRVLGPFKVGANSMTLNGVPAGGGGGPYDKITSSFGILNIGGESTFEEIKVGIGTETPLSAITPVNLTNVYGLEVNNDINLSNSVHNHEYRIGGEVVLQNSGHRKKNLLC